ncbi:MAG: glycosyltransferase family 4 protein [Lachnospiraceae bacterium]|jgi:glycosyltransferase involved in cell wall biosynthesis|nr:glycosyltransferase family 4 protein [Lachnospiraceae bacterium]
MSENENQVKRILYVRCAPYKLTFDSYNLQEVGLGNAFCRKGYEFDLVYYSKENRDQIIHVGDRKLRILWRKGFKFLRTGIYPFLIKKNFLKKYDIVITSEYSQIMSVILAKKHNNVFLYNGPYYNMFKIPFAELIYDRLFCKKINQLTKKTFCKTQLSADYIARKGITNTIVAGVGFDAAKFENEKEVETNTKILLEKMNGYRNLLYVGSIIPRKNIEFIIKTFVKLKKQKFQYRDVQLIIVGKGDAAYKRKCQSFVPSDLENSVIWYEFIKNAQLKFIYQAAQVFLLPSIHEIFGMVLLEAMYFGLPAISSHSAGAGTLIKNKANGVIVETFDEKQWVKEIESILDNPQLARKYSEAANKTICDEFLWDQIAGKIIEIIN